MRTKTIIALALILVVGVAAFSLEAWRVPAQPGQNTSPTPGPSPEASTSPAPAPSPGPLVTPAPSSSQAPTTSPSGDPVLIGAGDIADCSTDNDKATADLLASLAGVVFTAGDNAYPDGTDTDFANCYGPTWGHELGRTHPVPGNHDHDSPDLAGYLGYFGAAAAPAGSPWYSFDLGAWHVVMLDATCSPAGGCDAGSVQGRWLAADLAASTTSCTLAIWHQPRFSSGQHGDDPDVAPFWQALYAAEADVVINGHDHDYERFAPQDPAGAADQAAGIREFVVGTGGAELRPFDEDLVANSEVRLAGHFGILRLVLYAESYDWSFIDTTGAILDSGAGACH